jgi:hypothetical protein
MVVGVGFCKIKVDSNFLLVLKIKCTKFHQDRSKTVDLHTKYTNKQTFSFIYIDLLKQVLSDKNMDLCLNFIKCQIVGLTHYIGCSFKCILKVGVEESIVNAPQITDHRLVV